MFDVLEHLPSPVDYVREIFRILKPGGCILVETPNIDGFFARHVYRQKSDLVKPRAHICLYSPRTAARLFREVPFVKTDITTFPYCRHYTPGYFKSVIVSHLTRRGAATQLTYNESMRICARK
jgi:SAM-dependent methyltransferase